MCLAKILRLPVAENFLRAYPGLPGSPELVLVNLDQLHQRLESGALEPADYLAPEELATYHQFKYQKRQLEWLGGRLAAKQAVLRATEQEITGPAMREWSICADVHGKPFFVKSTGKNLPALSISHSHGKALAMTTENRDCGLDLQKISAATIRVKEKFCTPAEEKTVMALTLPDNIEATGLTLLWAAKEALRKARGGHPPTGFTAMQLTEVLSLSSHCWLFTMRLQNENHLVPAFFHEDFAVALSYV